MAAVNDILATRGDGLATIPVPRVANDALVTSHERLILILNRDADAEARERTSRSQARVIAWLCLGAAMIISFDVVSVLQAVAG